MKGYRVNRFHSDLSPARVKQMQQRSNSKNYNNQNRISTTIGARLFGHQRFWDPLIRPEGDFDCETFRYIP